MSHFESEAASLPSRIDCFPAERCSQMYLELMQWTVALADPACTSKDAAGRLSKRSATCMTQWMSRLTSFHFPQFVWCFFKLRGLIFFGVGYNGQIKMLMVVPSPQLTFFKHITQGCSLSMSSSAPLETMQTLMFALYFAGIFLIS